jgi:hypothetical protein
MYIVIDAWKNDVLEAVAGRNQIIDIEPLMDTTEHECLATGPPIF